MKYLSTNLNYSGLNTTQTKFQLDKTPRGYFRTRVWGAWPQNLLLKFVSKSQILPPKIYVTSTSHFARYGPKIRILSLGWTLPKKFASRNEAKSKPPPPPTTFQTGSRPEPITSAVLKMAT